MPTRGHTRGASSSAAAPDRAGVYALYEGDELIYIGRAKGGDATIRSRLISHQSGREGPCTQHFTHYWYETAHSDADRERELLEEFQSRHGRAPRCNERVQ